MAMVSVLRLRTEVEPRAWSWENGWPPARTYTPARFDTLTGMDVDKIGARMRCFQRILRVTPSKWIVVILLPGVGPGDICANMDMNRVPGRLAQKACCFCLRQQAPLGHLALSIGQIHFHFPSLSPKFSYFRNL